MELPVGHAKVKINLPDLLFDACDLVDACELLLSLRTGNSTQGVSARVQRDEYDVNRSRIKLEGVHQV